MRFGAIFATLALALSASAAAILPRDGFVNAVGAAGAAVGDLVKNIHVNQQNVNQPQKRNGLQGVTNALGDSGGLGQVLGGREEPCYTDILHGATGEILAVVAKIGEYHASFNK